MARDKMWRSEIRLILLLVAVGVGLGGFFGHTAWGAFVALLAVMVRWSLQLYSIHVWMEEPTAEPPETGGVWGLILDNIYQLQRRNREAQLRLETALDYLQDSLAAMRDAAVIVDARENIAWANESSEFLLGIKFPEDQGRPLVNLIRSPIFQSYFEGGDFSSPLRLLPVTEGDRCLHFEIARFGAGDRLIFASDTTENYRLEQLRRDFVANVSHELKTPVATIKGFVETLLDGAIDEPADNRRFLEIVGRQSDRLAAIIEDLLALSRIEQSEGAGSLPREPVAIASLLAAARSSCLPRATERGMAIELDCPDELVAEVNAALLEQAVLNLIDNAIKYSGTEKPIHVQATAEAIPGQAGLSLVISIRDEGNGIPAEHLPRLFERFYRVDKGRSRQVGGTGLGLSIVKHIVQAHGGTIAVVSERGQGSTFTLQLPLTASG